MRLITNFRGGAMRWWIMAGVVAASMMSLARGASVPPDWAAVRTALESMHAAHQAERAQWWAIRTEQAAEATQKRAALRTMIENSARANEAVLDNVVLSHGWPPRKEVGATAAAMAATIALGAPLRTQLRWVDSLRAAATRGDADMAAYAQLEDRIRVEQGKPQKYGTEVLREGDAVRPFPIADEAGLAARRKAAGLLPICDYLRQFVKRAEDVRYAACTADAR
jgi:hypothetical protein